MHPIVSVIIPTFNRALTLPRAVGSVLEQNFREFEVRIENMENEENFEWEDDLMDWKFAVENLIYWQKKEQLFSAK